MPTIPNGIKPVVESYEIGSPEGVMRVEVGGGLPRYGLEWDRGKQPFRVALHLNPLQVFVWTAFYHQVIKKGSIEFDMPLDSGFGSATHTVCMVPGSYSASRRGEITTVSFSVLAESAAYDLTESEALDLIEAHNGYAAGSTPAMPRGFQPVVENYSFGGPDGVAESGAAGGATAYAMEWDRGAQQFRATLILTAAQLQVWMAFFHHVAKKGAVSFEMDLDSGMGVEGHLVNIVPGTHSVTRNGVIAVVSFSVEAESTVYGLTTSDAEDLVDVYNDYGTGLSALLARIDRFANQDTLVLDL